MSHFSVLVVGEDVEGQLAPFECTGLDDQYVQTIDKTEEARAKYAAATCTRLQDPAGNLFEPYADVFYRDPTPEEIRAIGPLAGSGISWRSKDWDDGRGYRPKVRFVPNGWMEIEVPVATVEKFAKWAADWYDLELLWVGAAPDLAGKHKYGWVSIQANPDDEVVGVFDRTNPNKHWDWWVVGGRWSDRLRLKAGGFADAATKAEIDFEAMRGEAAAEARERWQKAHAVIAGRAIPVRAEVLGADPTPERIREARDEYWSNPVVADLAEAGFHFDIEEFAAPEEEYVARARSAARCTFAVVKDGVWYERGKMGWWCVVRDAMDDVEWERRFAEMIDALPDEACLTVVDCHI